jgi:predicted kinase
MAELIIPVGIPGCGKSTFAEIFFNKSTDSIWSTDQIRSLMGDVNDQSQNDEVFRRFHEAIQEDLVDGFRVFADATNLTSKARTTLRAIAKLADMDRAKLTAQSSGHAVELRQPVRTHLVVFCNPDQAVLRNCRRERVVPHDAMMRMLENYERFRLDLAQERHLYDTVTEIRSFG